MAESEKPETLPEQIARLKKEHKGLIAIEEADGILTGEVAQARLARQRHFDQLEREARNDLTNRAGYPLQGESGAKKK